MAISIWEVSITDAPLELSKLPGDENAGALVDFWGIVRRGEEGRAISGIEYEVHREMAQHQMKLLAERAGRDFALRGLVLRHRIGLVKVAEASLFLRTLSGHRPDAFAASQWLIDELKKTVPIWKRPIFVEAPNELAAAGGRA